MEYVKQILDGADLEKMTMKILCLQVYNHYPDFNLEHQKDLIKGTVRSILDKSQQTTGSGEKVKLEPTGNAPQIVQPIARQASPTGNALQIVHPTANQASPTGNALQVVHATARQPSPTGNALRIIQPTERRASLSSAIRPSKRSQCIAPRVLRTKTIRTSREQLITLQQEMRKVHLVMTAGWQNLAQAVDRFASATDAYCDSTTRIIERLNTLN